MNILIIEDETLAARQLQTMILEYDPSANILAIIDSVEVAVDWLQTHPHPDLMLADIELVDGKSFDVFEQVPVRCPVIFTTAYDEYALRAFQVNSIDYLLKPIDEKSLHRSLLKFRELRAMFGQPAMTIDWHGLVATLRAAAQHQTARNEYAERFLLKQGSRLFSVEVSDIAYFYTQDRLTFVRTWDNRSLLIDYKLDELEQKLNPQDYFRANRQLILHAHAIARIYLHLNGRLKLDLSPALETEIYVSRDKAAEFRNWLGE